MASDLKTKIVISAEDQASAAVDSVTEGIKQLDTAAEGTAPTLERLGQEVERLGEGQAGGLDRAAQAASELKRASEGAADAASGLGHELNQAGDQGVRSHRKISEGVQSISQQMDSLKKTMLGVFGASQLMGAAKSAIATADAFGQMAERIEMATSSQEEYEYVQQRLLESANTTYRALAEQQEMYIRSASALKELGYSTRDVLDITDSYSYLLATNAASQERGAAAVDAYTEALQVGKVEADAWQSILAATPTIVDAIAEASGKTAAEIRALGASGKLSLGDLNEGLLKSVEANKAATEGMSATVSDAMTRLNNTWGEFLRVSNESSGASAKLAGLIDMLSDNLERLAGAAVVASETVAAEFLFVEQLGIALAAGLTKSAARAQAAMEMIAAPFTDDTIAAAQERLRTKLQQIDDEYAALFDSAAQARDVSVKASADMADASDEAAAALTRQRNAALELTDALEDISSADLANLPAKLDAALKDGGLTVEEHAEKMRAVLTEAFERAGLDAQGALSGISSASTDALNTLEATAAALDGLGVKGEAAASALEQSFRAALDEIDSAPALEVLEARLQATVEAGKLGAEAAARLGDAMVEARKKIEDLTPGIQSSSEAMRVLGVTSQAELTKAANAAREAWNVLKAGGGTTEELRQGFTRYAEAAVAGNKGVVDGTLKAEAAQQGLVVTVDEAGKVQVRTHKEVREAAEAAAAANKNLGDSTSEAGDGILRADAAMQDFGRTTNDTASVLGAYMSVIGQLKDSIGGYSQSALAAVQSAEAQASSFAELANGLRGVANSAQQLMAADINFDGLTGEIAAARAEADKLNASAREMERLAQFSGVGFDGLNNYIAGLTRVEAALAAAKAKQLEFDLSVEQFYDRVDDGSLNLEQQADMLRRLSAEAEYYGSQNLDGLRSALNDVTRQLQDMSDAAKDAFGSLNDELNRLQGNYVAVEKSRAAAQRQDLTAQRDEAAAAGNMDAVAQLNAALGKLGEVESLRLQEAKARMQAERERAEDDRKRRAQESSGGSMTPSGGPTTVNVQLPPAGPMGYNRADLEAFARQLNPVLSDLSRRGAL